LVVTVPVMPVLLVVVRGIVGAGAGKQRASEKKDDEKFHRGYAKIVLQPNGNGRG
jgi:hypothetical protein